MRWKWWKTIIAATALVLSIWLFVPPMYLESMYSSTNTYIENMSNFTKHLHLSNTLQGDSRHPKSRVENPESSLESQITVIIKTMNRRNKVKTLVESIETFYLRKLKIIIGDDGAVNQTQHYYDEGIVDGNRITYHYFGFDIGLSGSRNRLVQLCASKYVILNDDDMKWNEGTDLYKLVRVMRTTNAHIVTMSWREAGVLTHYLGNLYLQNGLIVFCRHHYSIENPRKIVQTRAKQLQKNIESRRKCPNLKPREMVAEYGCYQTDIGLNLFIARTKYLAKHPWDEKLKMLEHEPWFWSLREDSETPRIFGCIGIEVEHNNVGVNPEGYIKMRRRVFKSKYNFNMKYKDEDEPRCCRLAEQRRNRLA